MASMTHGITAYMDLSMAHIGDIPTAIATGIMEEEVTYPIVTIPQGIMAHRVGDPQRHQAQELHMEEGILQHPMVLSEVAPCQGQMLFPPTTHLLVVRPIRVAAAQASVATGLQVLIAHQVITLHPMAPRQVAEAALQAIAPAVPAQVAASEVEAVAPVVALAAVVADAPAVAAVAAASVAADNQRILFFNKTYLFNI